MEVPSKVCIIVCFESHTGCLYITSNNEDCHKTMCLFLCYEDTYLATTSTPQVRR